MSNNLEWYHKILFIERPWMDATTTDAKYQQLLHELSTENFAQQPLYELSFPKPLTHKTKYYQALINNEAIIFINSVHDLMKRALNDNEKKYHIYKILSKKLPAKLHETEKIISARSLYFSTIDDTSIDKKLRDDAFILQNLKYQLIHLYLEIQDSFSLYLKETPLNEKDIHLLYFSEPMLRETPIGKAGNYNLPKPIRKIAEQPKKRILKVIKAGIRDPVNGILKYEEIIAKQHQFALAEEELFEINLIDADYNFIKDGGNNLKMAAVYHLMIMRKYFNSFYFHGGKLIITDLHIRKFLNYRYNTNIHKEFRNFKKKEILDEYFERDNAGLPLIIRF